jgi:hypothetical protein
MRGPKKSLYVATNVKTATVASAGLLNGSMIDHQIRK